MDRLYLMVSNHTNILCEPERALTDEFNKGCFCLYVYAMYGTSIHLDVYRHVHAYNITHKLTLRSELQLYTYEQRNKHK